MSSKLVKLGVRVVGKVYGLLLGLLTKIRTGTICAGDATAVLLKYATQAQRLAVSEAKARSSDNATPSAVRVLIIVPFRDRWDITSLCLAGLEQQCGRSVIMKIILVDNGSTQAETMEGIQQWQGKSKPGFQVEHLRVDERFNFSRLNNRAVQAFAPEFRPDFLLFLNNDVVLPPTAFLEDLVNASRTLPKAGAVGTTLYYPNGRVQHLFAAPGIKLVAAHPLKGRRVPADAEWFQEPRPVACTTGALLLVRPQLFNDVGGFDEGLPTLGQDIDLCLKLQKAGLINWVIPWLSAVHHEGASRGEDLDREQIALMFKKWGPFLTKNPYYSGAFSRWSEAPVLTIGWEPPFPWRLLV